MPPQKDEPVNLLAVVVGVCMVLVGCILNNITLEFIVREDPTAGSTLTLAQFLFISFEGFCVHLQFAKRKEKAEDHQDNGTFLSLKPRVVPIKHYVLMVLIFWTVSILNNSAFGFHIPVPLHMIFRSGSLLSSAFLGWLLLGKRYSPMKLVGISFVTLGIACATLSSASQGTQEKFDLVTFTTGIVILTAAMLLSSGLGLFQEYTYKHFTPKGGDKPSRESQFYSHALSLPFFFLVSSDVLQHLKSWTNIIKPHPFFGEVQIMWIYLLMNVLTQYVCIRGVFLLTGNLSALSTTLTITIRKFLSLMISIAYFQNPFSPYHWFGTVCVFGGSLLYVLGSIG